jgi:hypothetical protein
MRLLGVFVRHELLTQSRTLRFRALVTIYLVLASAPSVILFLASSRTWRYFGPAGYNALLVAVQPLLTVFLAVALSIDALSRERDEGSFSVLSVASLSSAGYVLRRWLAIVALGMMVSLVPPAVTAALALHTREALALLPMFFAGWLVNVLPPLLVFTALGMALGAITGRVVIAIVLGVVLATAGIGFLNDLTFRAYLRFGGPSDLVFGGERILDELVWIAHGYWIPEVPSDAGFPLRSEIATVLPRSGITAALALVLLAVSVFYLRRTRRDLRPWRVAETHPLRTLLKTANRVREEFAPDAGSSLSDRMTLAAGLLGAALLVTHLVREQSAFATLADARYMAETTPAQPTSTEVVVDSLHVDGAITTAGALRAADTLVVRNAGAQPQRHLSFMLNPQLTVRRVVTSGGTVRIHRSWERLEIELDPPLAGRQSRTLSFVVDGVPAEVRFRLPTAADFRSGWRRFRGAHDLIDVTDLSQSTVSRAATEVRMRLHGSDFAPVLRYTPWTGAPPDLGDGFVAETIAPPVALDLRLKHPYSVAVDSCGTIRSAAIVSRCTTGLASYTIFGGPLTTRSLTREATLAYIPAHKTLVGLHAPSLAAAISEANAAWPQLALPPHVVFVERPREPHDVAGSYQPQRGIEQTPGGAAVFVPEAVFTALKPMNANVIAASLVGSTLAAKRAVVPEQASFFASFYTQVAGGRLGLAKPDAVESGTGIAPEIEPLIALYPPRHRMAKVLASLEYRVGSTHFADGINAFVQSGPRPGTAKELLDDIGRRAGVDLSRVYDDYFIGHAIPKLTLEGVTFRRGAEGWTVGGEVRNTGTGEAWVPVALRTSTGSQWRTVRVDSGAATPFSFSAAGDPYSVQLDPDNVCYRQAAIGLSQNVEYRGGS